MWRVAATIAAGLTWLAGASAPMASIVQIDPKGTFLRGSGEYDSHLPLVLDLQALGFLPGSALHLRVTGDTALTLPEFAATDPLNSQDIFNFVGAVFSLTDELLTSLDQRHRVPGAIGAGLPALVSDPMLFGVPGDRETDIDEDFQIVDTYVRIPLLARYLFVAVSDVFYSDNVDPNGDLRLEISVPEPPIGLLFAALAGASMLAARRRASTAPRSGIAAISRSTANSRRP